MNVNAITDDSKSVTRILLPTGAILWVVEELMQVLAEGMRVLVEPSQAVWRNTEAVDPVALTAACRNQSNTSRIILDENWRAQDRLRR